MLGEVIGSSVLLPATPIVSQMLVSNSPLLLKDTLKRRSPHEWDCWYYPF